MLLSLRPCRVDGVRKIYFLRGFLVFSFPLKYNSDFFVWFSLNFNYGHGKLRTIKTLPGLCVTVRIYRIVRTRNQTKMRV